MFNTPPYHEDFILQFFCGLDDDYKDLCFAFHVHESSIIFNELHEKLLNHEAHLKENNFYKTPISSSPTFKPPHNQHRPPSYYPKNSIIQSCLPLYQTITLLFLPTHLPPTNLVFTLTNVNCATIKDTLLNVVSLSNTCLGTPTHQPKPTSPSVYFVAPSTTTLLSF